MASIKRKARRTHPDLSLATDPSVPRVGSPDQRMRKHHVEPAASERLETPRQDDAVDRSPYGCRAPQLEERCIPLVSTPARDQILRGLAAKPAWWTQLEVLNIIDDF